jgi:hypothetical protein
MSSQLLYGVLAGIAVNVLFVTAASLKRRIEARKKIKEVNEERFRDALASESLATLGSYLDTAVGDFSVAEYAENTAARTRVNAFLVKLQDFVGLSEEAAEQREPLVPPEPLQVPAPDFDLQKVESRIEQGALWDALAALRRTIEIRLIDLARRRGLSIPPQPGAGRLLRLLRERQVLSEDAAKSLQYAIEIANRGVHGVDVTTDEAIAALRQAQTTLGKLELLRH